MNADRNLLFGILALQNDFVTRDQLVAAMNDWVLEKQTPLGEILQRRGALASDVFGLLDALVDKQIAKHQGDVQASMAALSSVSDARSALQQISDGQVQATLRTLHTPSNSVAGTEPFFGKAADEAGRFTILRPHAAGGLGEVFVAKDNELDREVALKQIKEQYSQSSQQQSRFKLEAEVTGGLEHPGIVPVYSLGQYGDGRPFYAMRFIRGDSLKEAIDQFYRRAGGKPDYASLEFRGLLRRFIDVCNAIAYAHSRGILHRDLKPGNVMLGKYGETLVVDWGLAKAMGSTTTDHDLSQGPLLPPSASGSGYEATAPGLAIGTPAYMSPEQADGHLDELGPATDVYSLGATLYSILTGKPPFSGKTVVEILEKVRGGNFQAPRQVKPGMPKALAAVCVKAMALKPAERYAMALELSNDLDRWLAEEPVTAYREPAALRARRFMRRHQVFSAALLIGSVACIIGFVALRSERLRTESARNTATISHLANESIMAFLETVLEDARIDDLSPDILDDWRHARLHVLERMRDINQLLQNTDRGEAYLQEAFTRVESDVNHQIGRVFLEMKQPLQAMTHLQKALAAIESLLALMPWESVDNERKAGILDSLATAHGELGDQGQSRDLKQRADLLWKELCRDDVEAFPDKAQLRYRGHAKLFAELKKTFGETLNDMSTLSRAVSGAAMCMRAARLDKSLTRQEGIKTATGYGIEAIKWSQRALEEGIFWRDPGSIEIFFLNLDEPSGSCLRHMKEFQDLKQRIVGNPDYQRWKKQNEPAVKS